MMPDRRELIPIDLLDPAPWNPKHPIDGEHRAGLGASLDHFGVRDDLKVWPNPESPGRYVVLNGNQRLDLFRERGDDFAECRILADLDSEDAKLFTASFDRNRAMYDFRKLGELSESLKTKGADLRDRLLWLPKVNLPQAVVSAAAAIAEAASRPAAEAAERAPERGKIPFVFSISREGFEEVKAHIFATRNRLIQESRLRAALEALKDRVLDDVVVELALRIAAQ
jgi:hypothetical protein